MVVETGKVSIHVASQISSTVRLNDDQAFVKGLLQIANNCFDCTAGIQHVRRTGEASDLCALCTHYVRSDESERGEIIMILIYLNCYLY